MNNLPDIFKVLIFAAMAYVTMFVIAKILGKKQIAQLSFVDYVVGITIGSIAAEMATETEKPFYHYIIAMVVFLVIDLLISILSRKGRVMKTILCGKPLLLIKNGQLDYEELQKSKITVDELIGMAREKGFFDINEIAFGILETSGKLSILPKGENTPPTCKDLNLPLPSPALTDYYIVDGNIRTEILTQNGHDKKWLIDGLGIKSEKEVKNILLASFDNEKQTFDIHYKSCQA